MNDVDPECRGADSCDQSARLDLFAHVLESDKDEQRDEQGVRAVMFVEEIIEFICRQACVQIIRSPKCDKIADNGESAKRQQVFFGHRIQHEIGAEQEIADVGFEQPCGNSEFKLKELRQERQQTRKADPEQQECLEGFFVHVVDEQLQKWRHQIKSCNGVEEP